MVLFIFFKNGFYEDGFLENEKLRKKYFYVFKICGIFNSIVFYKIVEIFEFLKNFFVKKIGDIYFFYYDFVMEVMIFVFGKDYFVEIVKYVDIGFFRKSVKLIKDNGCNDFLIIDLNSRFIDKFYRRLFDGIF